MNSVDEADLAAQLLAQRALLEAQLVEARRNNEVWRERRGKLESEVEAERAERQRLQELLDKRKEEAAIRRGLLEAAEIFAPEVQTIQDAINSKLNRERCVTERLQARVAEHQEECQSMKFAEKLTEAESHAIQVEKKALLRAEEAFAEETALLRAELMIKCFEDAATQEDN